MAVLLDGPGGLFTRLGAIFGAISLLNSHRGAEAGSAFDHVASHFDGDEDLVPALYPALDAHRSASGSANSALASLAARTVVEMVRADLAQPDLSLALALRELIRQMGDASESVAQSTVTAVAAADAGNAGGLLLVTSPRLASGGFASQSVPETVVGLVAADGQPGGGATAGRERVNFRGQYAVAPLDWRWPVGSGAAVNLAAVSASDSERGAGGNWLANGDFSAWTAGLPDRWSADEGEASVTQDSSSGFLEPNALAIAGDGATNVTLSQRFGDAAGTRVALPPLTQLAFSCRIRMPTAGAGTLRVALVHDASGAVVQDEAGADASASVDLATVGTAFEPFTAALRTPAVLPDDVRLQLRLTTPLEASRTLVIDAAAATRMAPFYAGGPSLAAFSGAGPAYIGDRFTVAVANSGAGGFQDWFDRAFGMRGLGLILPESGAPTIDGSLITSSPSSA